MTQHFDVLDAVWAIDTDPTAKLVALRLARHWPRIFPGIKDIAYWTQLDERTVRRALRRLQDDGVLVVHKRPNSSSVYEFPGVSIPSLGNKPPLAKAPGAAPPPPGTAPPPTGRSAPTPGGTESTEETSLKRSPEETREGESARELLPHEKAELRKAALEQPTGARPVGLFQFRPGWKPPIRLRQLGIQELGLTEAEMLAELADCRLKLYERPFPSEEAQFERELRWLAEDKKTKAFREQRKANPHGFNESPGARRRPGDASTGTVFGSIAAASQRPR